VRTCECSGRRGCRGGGGEELVTRISKGKSKNQKIKQNDNLQMGIVINRNGSLRI
jgi:hypothetical protein